MAISRYAYTNSDYLKSDWVGRNILVGWLFGQWNVPGITPTSTIYLDNKWQTLPVFDIYNTPVYGKSSSNTYYGPYMMKNSLLTSNIKAALDPIFADIPKNAGMYINKTISATMENGEQMIGYQYLHGTNSAAGDFKITGTASKDAKGNVTSQLFLQWNDVIDPNFQYATDSIKAEIAQSIPGAKTMNYIIRISWDFSVYKPAVEPAWYSLSKKSTWPFKAY